MANMRLSAQHIETAILAELGARIAHARLRHHLSQQELANLAAVAKRTVERIEAGEPSSTANFIRLLRALGLIEQLNTLVPEITASPIEQLKRHGKRRQRAPSAKKKPQPAQSTPKWIWGDER